MATALAYPEKQQGKKSTSVFNTEVSNAYLNHARFVLRNCRDKALEVLRNSKYPLTVAYEEAQAIVEKQRIAEEERQKQLAALAILREEYSDLAACHTQEEIAASVDVAIQTVSNWEKDDFSKKCDEHNMEKSPDFEIPLYNVWS